MSVMERSNDNPMFRSLFSEDIFIQKYQHEGCETWSDLARTLASDVCSKYLSEDEVNELANMISDLKFIPGGWYLYYGGRDN